jgi:protein FRA10AC1
LRWRTAPEVVEGIGEDTCGSLRCRHHRLAGIDDAWTDEEWDQDGHGRKGERSKKRRRKVKEPPRLRAFELPFAYEEAGERKDALVKVKLCSRCEGKLRWKPRDEEDRDDEVESRSRGNGKRGRPKEDDSDSGSAPQR